MRRGAFTAITSGTEPVYRSDGLEIDVGKRRVALGDEEIHLTPTEYNVLTYLAANAGRVVTHGMVLRSVWGPEYGNETQLLRYTVAQLRKKLRDDPVPRVRQAAQRATTILTAAGA